MNRIHCAIILAVLISAPACAAVTAGAPATATQGLRLVAVQDHRFIPTDLTYASTAEGIEIQGRIRKRDDHRGRILGHAEVDLLDAQGGVVAHHPVALTHFNPTRKNPDWASFHAVITDLPVGVATIRVQHLVGTHH